METGWSRVWSQVQESYGQLRIQRWSSGRSAGGTGSPAMQRELGMINMYQKRLKLYTQSFADKTPRSYLTKVCRWGLMDLENTEAYGGPANQCQEPGSVRIIFCGDRIAKPRITQIQSCLGCKSRTIFIQTWERKWVERIYRRSGDKERSMVRKYVQRCLFMEGAGQVLSRHSQGRRGNSLQKPVKRRTKTNQDLPA